jgi:cyclophilin family peptidyl-prolyl cis-trans isomerase/protein-disulfide isomerase
MQKTIYLLTLLALLSAACGTPAPAALTPQTASAPMAKATDFKAGACTKFENTAFKTDQPSLFPNVTEDEHVAGPADAAVTIVEYSDFQCEGCSQMAYVMAYLLQKFPGQVRLVFRPFPLSDRYDKAVLSAQAAEAAARQGKFWEMHDRLFEKQATWKAMTPDKFTEWLAEQAAALGLDSAQFESDLKSPETAQTVELARQTALKIGLQGVPLLLINGEIQKPPYILVELENIVRLKMLMTRQFTDCPPVVIDPAKHYVATLKTAKGNIVIRLFADRAPNTVNSFVFLAQKGWFDNITFYRVAPGSVVQTGDPSETGMGNPGYFTKNERAPSLQFSQPGMVAMNNVGPDTNGSQFFITLGAASQLNGQYTIFGQVVSGMEVLAQLTPRDPQPGSSLPDGDALLSVTIEEK